MSEHDTSNGPLTYVPVRIIRPVGKRMGAPVDADLAIINSRFAADDLAADDIFCFDAVASSDALDSYSTRMDPETTLPNYQVDLAAGQALLESHDSYRLPFGSSFRAELQPVPDGMLEGVPATLQCFAGYYMLRNHIVNGKNTEDYRKGILGGTHRKMSIGFGGSDVRYVCDLDGKDLWDSPYYPGERLRDGTLVTYTILNARAMETSIVFKNGSPGALIQRVQALVDQRQIPPHEISRLEQRWGVRFAGALRAKPTQFFMNGGDQAVDEKQIRAVLDGILNRAGKKLSAATREKLGGAVKSVEEAVALIASLLEEADDDADRSVRSELGQSFTLEGVRTLKAQATAGAAYTKRLIDETVTAKTAVMGDAFTAEKAAAYRTRLERMAESDFAFIEDEHENWTTQRKATFKPGRLIPAGAPAAGHTAGDKAHSEYLDYGEEEGE